jgi:hypothetical protein
MGLWGMPLDLIQSVGWHHAPHLSGDRKFSVLTAVHAANAIASDKPDRASPDRGFDADYLAAIGLADRQNHWREACGLESIPRHEATAVKAP